MIEINFYNNKQKKQKKQKKIFDTALLAVVFKQRINLKKYFLFYSLFNSLCKLKNNFNLL